MGVLRNTRELRYSEHHNYILEVMARDCGKSERNKKPLIIDIVVTQTCSAGWKGITTLRHDVTLSLLSLMAFSRLFPYYVS